MREQASDGMHSVQGVEISLATHGSQVGAIGETDTTSPPKGYTVYGI